MKSTLVIFVLLAISILTYLEVANSSELEFSPYNAEKSFATSFHFETLAVAAGEHFIRGEGFDVPSRGDQEIAVTFGNLFLRLSIAEKLERILVDTSQRTATYYWKGTAQQRADTLHVHYSALKSEIVKDPELDRMYDEESKKVSQQSLPSLVRARINLDLFRNLSEKMNELIAEAKRSNEKFRKITLHVRFLQYSTGLAKDTRYEYSRGFERGMIAKAILQMSRNPEIGELTQQIYDQALEDSASRLVNQTWRYVIDVTIFLTIEETFQKDENLYVQLKAIKEQLMSEGD